MSMSFLFSVIVVVAKAVVFFVANGYFLYKLRNIGLNTITVKAAYQRAYAHAQA